MQTSQVPALRRSTWRRQRAYASIKCEHFFRDDYTAGDLPGGLSGTFKLKGKEYLRRDIQLVRQRSASWYQH